MQLNYSGQFFNNNISQQRHYCRNSRCRSKLNNPVDNPHKAFCCKGCHSSYFLKRCIVCENSKPGPDWKFCRRPRCRSRYHGNPAFYDWPTRKPGPSTGLVVSKSKSAHSTGLKSGRFADRPWRIVAAGSAVSACAYHCATLDPPKIEAWQPPQAAPKAPVAPTDLNRLPAVSVKISDDIPSDLLIPQFLRRESQS
jgi:hypothetical protein